MTKISHGLHDKVAVVTGDSRGIGLDLAWQLPAQGARCQGIDLWLKTRGPGCGRDSDRHDHSHGAIAETIDVVHPMLLLCDQGAGFITGQTLMVDGGASPV